MENSPIIKIRPIGFQWETHDPFLFCAHHLDKYPAGNDDLGPSTGTHGRNIGNDFTLRDGWRMYHGDRVPGFPVHPHRGFETITVVLEGFVDHADSMGAAGRYGQGDTQWMTAGSGVQHSEMFPLLNKTEENPLELFQIWLNLPKAKKMSKPYFTMLWADKIPSYHSKDSKGKITDISIIAGTIHGTKAVSPPPDSWAADPNNEVAVWTITMEPGAEFILPPASEFCNRTLYFHKGNSLTIGKTGIEMNHAIDLIPDAETVLRNGNKESRLLLLQGRPINEPAV
ncbi:MAG: pirin family protein, partial [Deltaproteobacteria bacterium]|nr:pirin family protein [Deltaproteobacteria bacterium]